SEAASRPASVVILKVDLNGVFLVPGERDPPIAGDLDSVTPSHFPRQRMKVQARQVHVIWPQRGIQAIQNHRDPPDPSWLELGLIISLPEPSESTAAERADHAFYPRIRVPSSCLRPRCPARRRVRLQSLRRS